MISCRRQPLEARVGEQIQLQATQIALPVARLLASCPEVKLAQVFTRTINLIAENGQFVSLIGPGPDPGPFSIVVQVDTSSQLSFEQMLQGYSHYLTVVANGCEIQIGNLRLLIEQATVWDPQLAKGQLHGMDLDPAISQIELLLKLFAPLTSLPSIYDAGGDSRIRIRMRQAESQLNQAVDTAKPEMCRSGAQLAAGLGIGLTPAGDDFLMGVLMAFWLGLVNPTPYIESLISGAVGRTGRLSMALLDSAGRGEASQGWHTLVRAITRRQAQSILPAVMVILGAGHTSGADALFGFMVGLRSVCRQVEMDVQSGST